MRRAWIDATAGVAGDMLLGALVDAGAPLPALQDAVDSVLPGAIELRVETVTRGGMRALHARVVQREPALEQAHRDWATIRGLLESASLHPNTRTRALDAFARLAAAEAQVHGVPMETVHFHEVGGLDAIADVVAVCEAVRLLDIDEVSASPVALGSGRIRAAHGSLPVPPPAVLELTRGWRVRALPGRRSASVEVAAPNHEPKPSHDHNHDHRRDHNHDHSHDARAHVHEEQPARVLTPDEPGELATPTGMALLRALATRCEAMPDLAPELVGVGAGGRDLPGWANCVRVVVGANSGTDTFPGRGELVELRANLDDFDLRLVPGVIDGCLQAGAVDAWVTPIQMKKGRPAIMVQALVDDAHRLAVSDLLLASTSTLGVRESPVSRRILQRDFVTLCVDGEPLVVKVGYSHGRVLHAAAEFSSIAAIASASGRTALDVAQRAASAIVAAGLVAGAPYAADEEES